MQLFEYRFADESNARQRQLLARAELSRILGEIRNNARPNQVFYFRRRLREHAAKALDANETLASALRSARASQAELDQIEANSAGISGYASIVDGDGNQGRRTGVRHKRTRMARGTLQHDSATVSGRRT
ncbi:hypothetical protein AB3X96_31105 [Paraburkholderia sp. BR13439]|uniref:hypothetical protein n=1 Tax=Paraburkholderia sp. BR13439 TaxID=3236996 RepID=UPI0034CD8038